MIKPVILNIRFVYFNILKRYLRKRKGAPIAPCRSRVSCIHSKFYSFSYLHTSGYPTYFLMSPNLRTRPLKVTQLNSTQKCKTVNLLCGLSFRHCINIRNNYCSIQTHTNLLREQCLDFTHSLITPLFELLSRIRRHFPLPCHALHMKSLSSFNVREKYTLTIPLKSGF